MKQPKWLPMDCEVRVKSLCFLEGRIKEDLMEAIDLRRGLLVKPWSSSWHLSDTHKLMRKSCSVAKRFCHLHSGPLPIGGALCQTDKIQFRDFNFSRRKELPNVSGHIPQLTGRGDWSWDPPFLGNEIENGISFCFGSNFPRCSCSHLVTSRV